MTIPALPPAPALGDSPEVFNTKAFAFVAALDDWGTAANAVAAAVDADATAADADAATATTQAGIATAKAGEATTAAGTATTKAGEAATSANLADASADAAALSEASAAGYAASIDPATIVKLSGNQTIAGVKTFSSTPVVPDGSFTYAKMQSVTAGKVLGRDTSGAGVVQELPIQVDSGNGFVGFGGAPDVNLHVKSIGNAWATLQRGNDASNISWFTWANSDGTHKWGAGMGTAGSNDFKIFNYTTSAHAVEVDTSSNLKFNSGYGSAAKAYGCRAWVSFNSIGTVSIYGSGNVSSISDNGVGNFSLNFSTGMPDTVYSLVGFAKRDNTSPGFGVSGGNDYTKTTSSMQIGVFYAPTAGLSDSVEVNCAVFR